MTEHGVISKLKDIVGAKYVLCGDDERSQYDNDRTAAYNGRSLAVVRPANTREVAEIVKLANHSGTPVVPQSGNTGLNGGASPGTGEDQIIVSLARMNKIRKIDPLARTVSVEAGVILDDLRAAADAHDLVFPLLFGARGSCMIGGNLSTNAGGSNVVRYGNTRELCLGIEVVMPDGDVVDVMSELRKDNTGYDLRNLMIGAEGTLGIITAAVMKLAPKPKAYATAMISVSGISESLNVLNALQIASNGAVEAFEYLPRKYFEHLADLRPELRPPFDMPADIGILVEVGAVADSDALPDAAGKLPVVAQMENVLETFFETGVVLDAVIATSETQRQEMWIRRELALEAAVARGPLVNSDVSVPLDSVEAFVDMMAARLPKVAPNAESGCIAHLGDGNLHYCVWPEPGNKNPVDPEMHAAIFDMIEDAVEELHGSFSAEHGIGLSKRGSMARRKDPAALAVMRRIKAALDPNNIMNPGKVLP